jgi:hypothetical protein
LRVVSLTSVMSTLGCACLNRRRIGGINPDGGSPAPEVLKAVVRANGNNAGIYGTVTRIGRLSVGQTIVLHR